MLWVSATTTPVCRYPNYAAQHTPIVDAPSALRPMGSLICLISRAPAYQSIRLVRHGAGGHVAGMSQYLGWTVQRGRIPVASMQSSRHTQPWQRRRCCPQRSTHSTSAPTAMFVGEGAAMVLIKPLNNALHNHDPIYAVVAVRRRSGWSHVIDDRAWRRSGPKVQQAYREAQVEPAHVMYMETMEPARPWRPDRSNWPGQCASPRAVRRNWCLIGSVKSNIGHLQSQLGIAGFLKAAFAVLTMQRFHRA